MHYLLIFLGMLTVAGCYPSPRYILHQGTDPKTGQPLTMRLNTETGEVMELGRFESVNGPWAVWSFSMNLRDAAEANKKFYEDLKADREKAKRSKDTNTGDLIIK